MGTQKARLRAPADFDLAIQQARMARGLSQTQLAAELDISQSARSEIENGKTLAVRTWFEIAIRPTTRSGGKIAPEKDPRLKYRRGLLVKK